MVNIFCKKKSLEDRNLKSITPANEVHQTIKRSVMLFFFRNDSVAIRRAKIY